MDKKKNIVSESLRLRNMKKKKILMEGKFFGILCFVFLVFVPTFFALEVLNSVRNQGFAISCLNFVHAIGQQYANMQPTKPYKEILRACIGDH